MKQTTVTNLESPEIKPVTLQDWKKYALRLEAENDRITAERNSYKNLAENKDLVISKERDNVKLAEAALKESEGALADNKVALGKAEKSVFFLRQDKDELQRDKQQLELENRKLQGRQKYLFGTGAAVGGAIVYYGCQLRN